MDNKTNIKSYQKENIALAHQIKLELTNDLEYKRKFTQTLEGTFSFYTRNYSLQRMNYEVPDKEIMVDGQGIDPKEQNDKALLDESQYKLFITLVIQNLRYNHEFLGNTTLYYTYKADNELGKVFTVHFNRDMTRHFGNR